MCQYYTKLISAKNIPRMYVSQKSTAWIGVLAERKAHRFPRGDGFRLFLRHARPVFATATTVAWQRSLNHAHSVYLYPAQNPPCQSSFSPPCGDVNLRRGSKYAYGIMFECGKGKRRKSVQLFVQPHMVNLQRYTGIQRGESCTRTGLIVENRTW